MTTTEIEKTTTVTPQQDIQTIDMTEFNPYLDDGDDAEHHTHIIDARENEHVGEGLTPQEIVDTARFLEVEITALCGYTWVPKRNPEKYPICQTCLDIWSSGTD